MPDVPSCARGAARPGALRGNPAGLKNRLASRAPLCCVAAMRSFSILSGLALAALAGACGPGVTTVSCEIGEADAGPTVAHSCTQFTGDPVDAVTSFDEACMGTPGSGCPTVGVLGTCSIPASPLFVTVETQLYYAWGDGTAYAACVACTANSNNVPGLWTTPEMTTPVRSSTSCPCAKSTDCPAGQTCQNSLCH
jgi:hypothetical protein